MLPIVMDSAIYFCPNLMCFFQLKAPSSNRCRKNRTRGELSQKGIRHLEIQQHPITSLCVNHTWWTKGQAKHNATLAQDYKRVLVTGGHGCQPHACPVRARGGQMFGSYRPTSIPWIITTLFVDISRAPKTSRKWEHDPNLVGSTWVSTLALTLTKWPHP